MNEYDLNVSGGKYAKIARVAHEVNRAYCQALGDQSQLSWEQAPDWQKRSAILGVMNIHSGDVGGPGDSHRSWLAHKQDEGWKWGPIKDEDLKEHPCFKPFEDLPAREQAKDYLFYAVVSHLLRDE